MVGAKPFELLQQISLQAENSSVALPVQEQGEEEWRGIGFRVAGQTFITPMSEVDEILYLPNCTKVPGVKPWVNGIANVRGRLLSIIDLEEFFGGQSAAAAPTSRVLAVRKDDIYSGVIVEEVLGMQTFSAAMQVDKAQVDDQQSESSGASEMPASFVTGAFERDEKIWTIFSLYKLVQSPGFLQVAV